MDKFFEAIRENSSKLKWSQAVALSRKSDVQIDKYNKDECSLLLSEHQKPISSSVKLWFEDEDWSCDCTSKEDPCIHVITSAILLRNKKEQLEDPTKAKHSSQRLRLAMTFLELMGL